MKQILVFLTVLALGTTSHLQAQNYVTIYRSCNYSGDSQRLTEGDYRDRDLKIGNDRLSAIRIPRGWEVTVYTSGSFDGKSRTFRTDVECMPADLNDQVSSIRVSRTGGGNFGGSGGSGGSAARNEVRLYVDCDYRGRNVPLREGTYNANELRIGNDELSSLRVGRDMQITLYTDNYQRGRSVTLTRDENCLPAGFNNEISSVRIERKGSGGFGGSGGSGNNNNNGFGGSGGSSSGSVALFADCNYSGRSMRLGPGSYRARDLSRVGNDNISALQVPRGYEVILYADDNYRGQSARYTGDERCLPIGINNRVSSLVIRRIN
jgi:hypothetical protein